MLTIVSCYKASLQVRAFLKIENLKYFLFIISRAIYPKKKAGRQKCNRIKC